MILLTLLRNSRTKAGLVNHSQDDDLGKGWNQYCAAVLAIVLLFSLKLLG